MTGKGILIVSESQDTLIELTVCLTQLEFDVVMDPKSLKIKELSKSPHLKGIFIDLEMSGIDGMSMLRYLRKLHPSVPIIVLSIQENVMKLVRAVEEGATDFLMKPIDSHQLREKCTLVFD
jgi:DNA-binding NtrC family response regulator